MRFIYNLVTKILSKVSLLLVIVKSMLYTLTYHIVDPVILVCSIYHDATNTLVCVARTTMTTFIFYALLFAN